MDHMVTLGLSLKNCQTALQSGCINLTFSPGKYEGAKFSISSPVIMPLSVFLL